MSKASLLPTVDLTKERKVQNRKAKEQRRGKFATSEPRELDAAVRFVSVALIDEHVAGVAY